MLPHKFFLWHFLSVMFHMCFFSAAPTLCSPPNFHCQSPPTHNFTGSCPPQILEKAKQPLAFSLHIVERKNGLPPKGQLVHIKGFIFPRTFSSQRSPVFALGKIRIYALSLLVGPPSHFLPVDWFSHQKFLIMSQ